jgi:hypothetical protein
MKMYLVTINNTYTNEAQTKDQISNALKVGGEVAFRKSRKNNDCEFVTVNGHTIARAFFTQSAQIKYLVKQYIETQIEIQTQIEKLQASLATHNEKASHVHWGHVGDMNYILSQLKELNGEEE